MTLQANDAKPMTIDAKQMTPQANDAKPMTNATQPGTLARRLRRTEPTMSAEVRSIRKVCAEGEGEPEPRNNDNNDNNGNPFRCQ